MSEKYTEREYTSKRGFKCLESSAFGKMKIYTQDEINEQIDGNEAFAACEFIEESKYLFYLDEETWGYFAVLK